MSDLASREHEPDSLILRAAPYVSRSLTTPRLMTEVLIALVPVVAAAVVFFGPSALLVLAASTLGSVLAEWAFGGRRGFVAAFRDGSAPLTGLLLGLTLPPAIPLWMAVLGGAVAIALGKTVFGGLGQNVFNPALVGRAFLQAAFPTVLTTWSPPAGEAAPWLAWRATNFAFPFLSRAGVDSVTAATPLSLSRRSVMATKSSTELAKMLAITVTPRSRRVGNFSLQKNSTPTFASPIAFSMPAGVSQMRSGGLP